MLKFYDREFTSRLLVGTALYPSPAATIKADGDGSPLSRGRRVEGYSRGTHPHPPWRGVMISISSPLLSAVSAQRLFGSTS